MKSCKTCKWWEPIDSYFDDTGHHCEFIDTIHAEKAPESGCEILYTTLDNSGLDIILKTGPDFVCPNYESTKDIK